MGDKKDLRSFIHNISSSINEASLQFRPVVLSQHVSTNEKVSEVERFWIPV